MEKQNTHTSSSLLRVLLVCSSVLGIAGYLFHNEIFFLVASGVCTAILAIVLIIMLLSSTKQYLPLYLFYGLPCILLLVIGCLVTRRIGGGLLLGCDLIGIGAVLITWFTERTHRTLSEWLTPNDYSYPEDEAREWEDYLASLLDDSALPEERIRAMGEAFAELGDILSGIRKQQRNLEDRANVVKLLSRYMDSGLWKKDFEAEEKGELISDIDEFGVLSEDGLYNLLEDTKEILED